MKRSEIRTRKNADGNVEFCQLEVTLRNDDTELSICGAAGYVLTERQAKRQAREYWESYFEEEPDQIRDMNDRYGTNFRSPRSAAKYVLQHEGEFHGLDIVEESDGKVYVGHSWGQIREELARFFPEVTPFFAWHLNGLNAECEHQRARGETWGNSPGIGCLNCGWKLGHGWYKRALPPEVIEWAKTGNGTCPEPAASALEGEIYIVSGYRRRENSENGNTLNFELRGNAAGVEQAEEQARKVSYETGYEHVSIISVRKDGDEAAAILAAATQQAACIARCEENSDA